ncbi:MAG: hypothetical protein ACTSRG_06880 [Candidatus Helarchaeota archaeon]
MVKGKRKSKTLKKMSIKDDLMASESFEDIMPKIMEKNPENSEARKGIYSEITKELQSTFSQPKFGLTNRSMNVMARIDEQTSKILDALVELELAPSRSSAAAYLISEGILRDKEKYLKILESFETIKQAKARAQYSFYKSIIEEDPEKEKDIKKDIEKDSQEID